MKLLRRMAKLFGRLSSKKNKQKIAGGKVPILVYDKSKEGNSNTYLFEPDEKCENVCRKLGQTCSLTPAMLHCFSLAAFNEVDSCFLWLGPHDKLGDYSQFTIHFRMRFLPSKDKCDQVKAFDQECLCYIFLQVKWDFIHDKIEIYTDKEKKESPRGVVVLCILTMMRWETEQTGSPDENVNTFLENNDFKQFMPKSLLDNCNFIDEKVQRRHMLKKVDEYQKNYPSTDSKALMEAYIKNLLKEDLKSENKFYYLETYYASERMSKEKELKVVIEMQSQPPQVLITDSNNDTVFSSCLNDLTEVEMMAEADVYRVNIRKFANNQSIYFPTKFEAVSFVTCLDTLYRLTQAFDQSLCSKVEPTEVQTMKKIRAHGPLSNEFIDQKLKKREKLHNSGSRENAYVLRASATQFDAFEALYIDEHTGLLQIKHLGKILRSGEEFQREGCYLKGDLKSLVMDAIKDDASTQASWLRLIPQSEGCDILQNILQDKTEDNDEDEDVREWQPKVYTDSSLKLQKLIGQGHFTETHEAILGKEMVVVKRLRCTEIPEHSFRVLQESFQDSCDKLLVLRNPKYVVDFIGVVMSKTPTMVMKMYKHGNLRSFLQSREPREHQLTLKHLCSVLFQLAQALDEMETKHLCHGNLHCDNLMVSTFERNEMTVVIADPGLVTFYSQLKLDSIVNKRRLPWLAPELYKNLFDVTIKSDMFAFGTTLWQIFSEGANPLDVDPMLKNKSTEQIRQFFMDPDSHLSCPLYLKNRRDDSTTIKLLKKGLYTDVILKCWSRDPEERIDPKSLLRNFNNLQQTHCTDYHDYNVIPDEYSVSSGFNSAPSNYGNDYKGVAAAIQTRLMPLADLESLHSGKWIQQPDSIPQPTTVTDQEPATASRDQGTRPKLPSNKSTNQKRQQLVSQSQFPLQLRNGHDTPSPISQNPSRTQPRIQCPLPVRDVKHLIAEDRLTVHKDQVVGQGHYGKIYIGTLAPTSNLGLNQPTKVAVKVLKQDIVNDYGTEFIDEAKVMEGLDHKNIVKFYGVCRNGEYLVMEYVDNQSLYMFVKKEGDRCAPETLLKFCVDIAAGMEYLSSQKVLHRDLAARNVLITQSLDAKISDFGMSLILEKDQDYYRRSRNVEKTVPVLWSAPEWIGKKIFTHKSDVWSFGVTLWEVYSKGRVPNICKDLEEFKHRGIQMVRDGHRLKQPSRCSNEVYELMKQCWLDNPDNRPSFTDCHRRLRNIAGISDSDNESDDSSQDYSRGNEQNILVQNTTSNVRPVVDTSGLEAIMARGSAMVGNATAPPIHTRSVLQTGTSVPIFPSLPKPIATNGLPRATPTGIMLDISKLSMESKKLGAGGFGAVYKGVYDNQPVAVKKCTQESEYKRFQRETDLLSTLHHPNIVKFVGFIHNDANADLKKLELVMEFMNCGNLYNYLTGSRASPVTLSTKLGILIDVAEAMNYLYRRRVLHCDLTAQNVLLSGSIDDLTAKITDFGWAKKLDEDDNDTYTRNGAQFKPAWTAIEVLERCNYTPYSDIWSFGCVAIETFGDGKSPMFNPPLKKTQDNKTVMEDLRARLQQGERFVSPENCPAELWKNVLLPCWKTTPSDRIKFDQIVNKLQSFRARTNNET